MHLNTLLHVLTENRKMDCYPCIGDLVANGLKPERFSDGTCPPSRLDITRYLASWFKHIGVSADECREWMIEYCVNVLSVLSSSSPSSIRHSTKSYINYIYKSDVSFECGREKNLLKLQCDSGCPAYKQMAHVSMDKKPPGIFKPFETTIEGERGQELFAPQPSVKAAYKEQFEKAMRVARDRLAHGHSRHEVVRILNEDGLKTRTGRNWSYALLALELQRLQNMPE